MEIYTIKEVAELLKIPEPTIYEYTRKHIIQAFRIGRHVRIREEDLKKAMEQAMQ